MLQCTFRQIRIAFFKSLLEIWGGHQRQVGVVRRIADGAGVPNEVQRRQIFCLQPVAKPVGNVGPVEVGLRVFFPEFSDADKDLLRQEVCFCET
ncbi:MAG: hypothetical protein O7G31_11195 [Calditrichaeota bacterium]|nr:hypothetical protein [Calditrichota bacterium]